MSTAVRTDPVAGCDEDRATRIGRPEPAAEARPSSRLTVSRALVAADLLALALAAVVAQLATGALRIVLTTHGPYALVGLLCAGVGGWFVATHALGLTRHSARHVGRSTSDELGVLASVGLVASWCLMAGLLLVDGPPEAAFVWFGAYLTAAVPARTVARGVAHRATAPHRVLVLGAGEVGRSVAGKLRRQTGRAVEVVGFVDASPLEQGEEHGPVHHDLDALLDIVRREAVDRVVVAFSTTPDHEVATLVRRLADERIEVDVVPRLFELVGPDASLSAVQGLPVLSLGHREVSAFERRSKRLLDIVLASLGLIAVSPLFAVVALRIRRESPGPVFYRSARVGAGGRPFAVLKFRTMHLRFCRGDAYGGAGAEAEFARLMEDPALREQFTRAHKLETDPRVTRVGALLRRTSLDELPQLINVIRGDLSLVGPRAITREEWDMLVREGRHHHEPGMPRPYWEVEDVRPGLTGFWQVSGRSSNSFHERVLLDDVYAAHRSLRLDLAIMARTVRVMIKSEGAC